MKGLLRSILTGALFFTYLASNAGTVQVNADDKDGTVIQQAIRNADPFDTVLVHKGTYHEHGVVIDKPLYLKGIEEPIIHADSQEVQLFIVQADSVTIEGFVFKNMGMSYMEDLAAIKVIKSRGGTIRNNLIRNAFFGIYLQASEDYLVKDNHITGNARTQATSGNAIHLWKSGHSTITGNYVKGYRDGIYFEFVNESRIENNISVGNLRYGLHFMFSNHDLYRKNTFRDNGAGVAVMFSKKIEMRENLFIANKGGSSYGLLLKEINYSKIQGNTFEDNTVGITAEGTNDVVIDSNQFLTNGKAIDMKGNCLNNKVRKNNFIANTFEIVTNSKYNKNTYSNNYWSQYVGYDLNDDGIGDEPYRPMSLFSRVINKIPAAAILLHSFFVDLLELGEKAFPTLVTEDLQDHEPSMKAFDHDRDNGAEQKVRQTAGIIRREPRS